MKRAAVIVGLVVFLVLAGTGVGYAVWTASSTISTTVTIGSFEATLEGVEQLDAVHTATSGPHIATLTLGVTGTGPIALELATTSDNPELLAAIRLRMWAAPDGRCPATVPDTELTPTTLATPQIPTEVASGTAPATVVLCAATDIPERHTSYAGQQATAQLTMKASLSGSTWVASASGEFVQTVGAAAPTFSCTTLDGNVTITWENTATANAGTIYRSLINGAYPAGWYDRDSGYRSYTGQGWIGTGLPAAEGTYPWIIEEITDGVASVAYSGEIEVYWYSSWGAWGLRCVD